MIGIPPRLCELAMASGNDALHPGWQSGAVAGKVARGHPDGLGTWVAGESEA